MRYATLILCLGLAIIALAYWRFGPDETSRLPDTGKVEEYKRTLTDYKGLVVDGPFIVTLEQGKPKLLVTAEPEAAKAVVATIRGGTLSLFLDRPIQSGKPILVRLDGRTIETIELRGTSQLTIHGGLGADVQLIARDAGRIDGAADCQKINIQKGLAADIEIDDFDCAVTPAP